LPASSETCFGFTLAMSVSFLVILRPIISRVIRIVKSGRKIIFADITLILRHTLDFFVNCDTIIIAELYCKLNILRFMGGCLMLFNQNKGSQYTIDLNCFNKEHEGVVFNHPILFEWIARVREKLQYES
jgi:hypothetical protein